MQETERYFNASGGGVGRRANYCGALVALILARNSRGVSFVRFLNSLLKDCGCSKPKP